MNELFKKSKFVGDFIKKRRESLGLSQRSLGKLFIPVVTTQFVSNVERGVTPLPPAHVPVLAKILKASEAELMNLLEKEFTLKLNGRLGKKPSGLEIQAAQPALFISSADYDFMRSLYDAFHGADLQTRQAFATVCESLFKLPVLTTIGKIGSSSNSSGSSVS